MNGPVSVRYHRLVDRDAGNAFRYYRDEGGRDLAERFYVEFLKFPVQKPGRAYLYQGTHDPRSQHRVCHPACPA